MVSTAWCKLQGYKNKSVPFSVQMPNKVINKEINLSLVSCLLCITEYLGLSMRIYFCCVRFSLLITSWEERLMSSGTCPSVQSINSACCHVLLYYLWKCGNVELLQNSSAGHSFDLYLPSLKLHVTICQWLITRHTTTTTTVLLHLFNSLFFRTTCVSWHQKGKPFWILLEQEMTGWQWHQLDDTQIICTSLWTDNHASTSPLKFLQAKCRSCHPTNSIKAVKEQGW